jgi:hypothetical protein
VANELATIQHVRRFYPSPLGSLHSAFLIDVAHMLGGGAGLLRKPTGTNIQLPDGVAVAQDIICYPDGHIYDMLIDAEGVATPAWTDKGVVEGNRYYAVAAPVPSPTPEPEPSPPSVGDLDAIRGRLDLLETIVLHLDTLLTQVENRLNTPTSTNRAWGHTHDVRIK